MIFKRHVLARRLSDLLPLVLLGALGVYSLWPWLPLPGREARPRTIAFYGFNILGEVMNTRVFPAFEADWQARTGQRVQFVSALQVQALSLTRSSWAFRRSLRCSRSNWTRRDCEVRHHS